MEGLGVLCQVHMHGATAAPHTARAATGGNQERTVQEVCRQQQESRVSACCGVCRMADWQAQVGGQRPQASAEASDKGSCLRAAGIGEHLEGGRTHH